jgi:hypothetical protein
VTAAKQKLIPFCALTFKNRASYMLDGRTATLQMLHFIYIFSTNISTEYFDHAAHFPFFSSKCRLFYNVPFLVGHAVAQLVEALRYKPEGRRFDSRWCHWIFSLT